MSEPVPINLATDEEVFNALSEHCIKPIHEEFLKAVAATSEVARQPLDAETMKARISPLWSEVWRKLESADYVLGHIRLRISKARSIGILDGDPRERDAFRAVTP
jgi:hypothetical protein